MKNNFVGPEDEAELRVMARNMYRNYGLVGVLRCLGEMYQSINVICEVVNDELEKEKKEKNK